MIKRQPGFLRGAEPRVQDEDEPEVTTVGRDLSTARPMEGRPGQCTAHRRNGKPCQKQAIRGASVCRTHGGAAPQVVRAAKIRLAMAADPAAARMVAIMEDPEASDGIRLAASKEILDRTGVTSKQTLEVTSGDKPFEVVFSHLERGGWDDEDPEESSRLERESASETQGGDVVDAEVVEDDDDRPGLPFQMTRRRPGGQQSEMDPGPGAMPLMTFEEAYGGPANRRRGTRMSRRG